MGNLATPENIQKLQTALHAKAEGEPGFRFDSLYDKVYLRNVLEDAYACCRANQGAAGVDGERFEDIEVYGVERWLGELAGTPKKKTYRPRALRRLYVPKPNGKLRPLSIPSFEDRLVQDRLSGILQAIWEPEFLDCSYGFRPQRNAHQALRRLAEIITVERTQWLVEADVKGFFDQVSHDHLKRFLAHRIGDPRLLRIIDRFLKAGVLEDGAFRASDQDTPQGGLVSPVLANIYLHYTLDIWFEKRFAKSCRGRAFLVRYADDFLACFTQEEDARRFLIELRDRLAKFSLEVEPTKTRLLRFGDQARAQCKHDDCCRPPTFNFLGLTHFDGRSRRGRFVVGRKTQRERLCKKLKALNVRLADLRTMGGKAMLEYVVRHLQGHIQYYGVSGNFRSVQRYRHYARRLLFKWLNRRSQRRSVTWTRFQKGVDPHLPRARIVHNLYPPPPWKAQAGSRMV